MEKIPGKAEDQDQRESTDKRNYRPRKRNDKERKPSRHEHGNGQEFRGQHDELKSFVYTYDSAARANQYDKTTEKVAEWVKKDLSFSMDT